MPTLGAPLDLAKYEARNLRAHILGAAPSSPVTGQMYYNSGDNTLYWYDGTGWVAAKSGAVASDATTTTKGIVQLAGDLTGTAASPQIAAGVITDTDVNAANKDGAVGTPSLRTLGAGAAQAMPGNRTLDSIAPPATNLMVNGKQITNLAAPTDPDHAANKGYVDGVAQGLDAKESVRFATTGNITLNGNQAVDGSSTSPGQRVLVKDQTNPNENGIYVTAAGAWTRAPDADVWAELPGAFTFVESGGTNPETGWVCSVDPGGTIGSTPITWIQFSAAGQIVAGNGLIKTGNTLDVGAGAGLVVGADAIAINNNGVTNAMLADGAVNLATADVTGTLPVTNGGTGQSTIKAARETGLGAAGYYSSATHSSGTAISIPQATHGLRASKGLIVQVQDEASGAVELPDVVVGGAGDVVVTYGASVGANSKRVTILG